MARPNRNCIADEIGRLLISVSDRLSLNQVDTASGFELGSANLRVTSTILTRHLASE